MGESNVTAKPRRAPRWLRGAARRLNDAGRLLRTGTVPASRAVVEPGYPAQEAEPIFFGWTRYSYFDPRSKAFVAAREGTSEEGYKAQLWSVDRMDTRSKIFLGLSVPLLQEMAAAHDYQHFVTYSADMPDPWQTQLRDVVDSHDVLVLHPGTRGLQYLYREHLIATGSPSRVAVTFRVDDDDLLALDYLDQLSAYANRHDQGRVVSLANGFSAVWHGDEVAHLRQTYRRLGSQGQANIGWWDAETQTLDLARMGNHATVDRRMPTILDSRAPAFVQMRHVGQDTAVEGATLETLRPGAGDEPEDLDSVLDLFPTLRKVYRSP